MITLPSLGRPEKLKRFIDAYISTEASAPVHVVLDGGDPSIPEYDRLDYPPTFLVTAVPAGTPIPAIQNAVLALYPDADYYAFMGDDCVPETGRWDMWLIDACRPDKIAWGDDGLQGRMIATHPFIGGALARKIGWVAAPGFTRFYTDNVITDIANGLGRAVYLPAVKTIHYHYSNGKAEKDATYRAAPPGEPDGYAYQMFLENDLSPLLRRLQS